MYKVLIVDDNPGHIKACKHRLSLSDALYEIESATSAQKAINLLKKNNFDIVITDLRMPTKKYEGFKVIKFVKRKDPAFHHTKIIVWTVVGDEEPEEGISALRLALQWGISDYIIKGWENHLDILDLTIQKILQSPSLTTFIKNQVFVACPYDRHHSLIYNDLKKKTKKDSFIICRADEKYKGDYINGIITKLIAESEFIISFVSGLNKNVLYELGLAHGMAKKVIIIKDDKTKLTEDLKGIQYISYNKSNIDNLINKIRQALKDFRPKNF